MLGLDALGAISHNASARLPWAHARWTSARGRSPPPESMRGRAAAPTGRRRHRMRGTALVHHRFVSEVPPPVATRDPVTILLQGGIASGKSTVSRLLAQRGAHLFDADRIAHEVLAEPAIETALKGSFGVRSEERRVGRERRG